LHLSPQKLLGAELYWLIFSQEQEFKEKIQTLTANQILSTCTSSSLNSLHPVIAPDAVLRVGGRLCDSSYVLQLRLLHAGLSLVLASLSDRYHVIGSRKTVCSVVRGCLTCRKLLVRPQPQMLGQLPCERTTPGSVFENVGVDYAGPVYVKYGHVRKPVIVKACICVFVSFSVKAAHLELMSDLTTDVFIAALRQFIDRRGKPSILWSDHGTNFIGAARELKELAKFFEELKTQDIVSQFCTSQGIKWTFIPEHAPHFGGL